MDSKSNMASKFKGMKMPMAKAADESNPDEMFGQSDGDMADELSGAGAAADESMKPNPAMTKFTDDEVMAEFKARGLDQAEEAGESPEMEASEQEPQE